MEPLEVLRNRETDTAAFRAATRLVGASLLRKMHALLSERHVAPESVVFTVILRSGIALLEPALLAFPEARVGVVGLKRDETTFEPYWYYENLPMISKESTIIILDPMLATGGSAEAVVTRLIERGADSKRICFLGIIAAPEGVARLARVISMENMVLAATDEGLTAGKLITPGLGDFGDRYFGYPDAGCLHGTIAR
jgi:uracil phosphoribosyltransferase